MKPIPLTAADLIAELDAAYPARPPLLADTERTVWWKAGQRELVENLLLRLQKTNEQVKLTERR